VPAARDLAPGRGESPGNERGTAPSGDYDPTRPASPRLNLDALRNRVREIAREGSGNSVFAFPLPLPDEPKKSKLSKAIEDARKPDCRTAYQGLGLLAAVPLIANQFGDGSCRW
jgi:hypothetical protein